MPHHPGNSKQQTISTPPSDILRLLIIECLHDTITAFKKFDYSKARGLDREPTVIVSNLKALWNHIQISYYYHNKEKHNQIQVLLESEDIEELRKAFFLLRLFLYDKKVTQWDGRKKIDTTNMELENLEKGL